MKSWQTRLKGDPLPWLLSAAPWTRYRTMLDLLDYEMIHPDVQKCYSDMIRHPKIQELSSRASWWFPDSVTRHNVPYLSIISVDRKNSGP
ncbi:hypothetical protein JW935_11895 [candidate division KSB1 bacterium]|nr:hypothetical protein [candidate division KSB1 bacterium]